MLPYLASSRFCPTMSWSWTCPSTLVIFFFFNDTATTEIYTLSLHDALPISPPRPPGRRGPGDAGRVALGDAAPRSEEHTSELQSLRHLVCRLLLEKKKSITV